jgi:hypothetical protein
MQNIFLLTSAADMQKDCNTFCSACGHICQWFVSVPTALTSQHSSGSTMEHFMGRRWNQHNLKPSFLHSQGLKLHHSIYGAFVF